jgi:hypothetical protein
MKLTKLNNTRYSVFGDMAQVEGDLDCVSTFLIKQYEVDPEELEYALAEMAQNGHDSASFGIDRRLVCTFKAATIDAITPELRAIRDVRVAFHEAYIEDPGSVDTRISARNLQSLYIALNVNGLLDILDGHSNNRRSNS